MDELPSQIVIQLDNEHEPEDKGCSPIEGAVPFFEKIDASRCGQKEQNGVDRMKRQRKIDDR